MSPDPNNPHNIALADERRTAQMEADAALEEARDALVDAAVKWGTDWGTPENQLKIRLEHAIGVYLAAHTIALGVPHHG